MVGDEHEPPHQAIDAALALGGDVDAIRRYYASWAADYDADVGAEQYALPHQVALLLAAIVDRHRQDRFDGLTIDPSPPDATILDVGCGTGLVGERLAVDGYEAIDGVDLSAEMIERAERRGCYRSLRAGIDITMSLPADLVGRYDIVCVGGVLTVGHVPPTALAAVATMVRSGGLLLVTTRRRYYDETGYQGESDRLEATGRLRLLHRVDDAPYTLDSPGHYWAYAVN